METSSKNLLSQADSHVDHELVDSLDFDTEEICTSVLSPVLLALELADRVTMKRDLEIAREIQHWLVPAAPPRVPGVDIAFATRRVNTVAGD